MARAIDRKGSILAVRVAALGFVLAVLTGAPAYSQRVDDLRVRQLETEVMRLQRELDAQSRRLDALERGQREAAAARPSSALPSVPSRQEDDSPAWLISTNWDKVRPGMRELDVIALLGRPTTVRIDPDRKGRLLMYAMELGPNAILAGNVRFTDAGVVEVNRPQLR
jgi:hypothetical protein